MRNQVLQGCSGALRGSIFERVLYTATPAYAINQECNGRDDGSDNRVFDRLNAGLVVDERLERSQRLEEVNYKSSIVNCQLSFKLPGDSALRVGLDHPKPHTPYSIPRCS